MSQWDEIQFWASFGHEQKKVDIGKIAGTGGEWALAINNYHQAYIWKTDLGWRCSFQRPDWWITADDLHILCELVAEYERTG